MQRWLRRLLGGESPPKPKPAPEKASPQNQADQAREYLSRKKRRYSNHSVAVMTPAIARNLALAWVFLSLGRSS